MKSRRSPNQRDIASAAGVSQAAVSLVLNGRAAEQGIPQATQDRIHAAMTELDYVPNAAARSLKGGRNNLIGVHTFEQAFPVNPSDYYREFLTGIEERAAATGLDLVLFASTQRADGTRSIYGRGSNRLRLADGSIILGFKKDDAELTKLAAEGYPFVFIGRRDLPDVQIPYISADYETATANVVDMLHEHGHRRITYLGDILRGSARDERFVGFEAASHAAGDVDAHSAFLDAGEVTEEWLTAQVDGGMTALVIEGSELTAAVYELIDSSSEWTPSDFSVVSLDAGSDIKENREISHVGIPRREMGQQAVDLLMRVLEGDALPGAAVVLPCEPPTTVSIADIRSDAAPHTPRAARHTPRTSIPTHP